MCWYSIPLPSDLMRHTSEAGKVTGMRTPSAGGVCAYAPIPEAPVATSNASNPCSRKRLARILTLPLTSACRRTVPVYGPAPTAFPTRRSEEHTSELQSLMRISYAVFCLKKKKKNSTLTQQNNRRIHNQHTNNH